MKAQPCVGDQYVLATGELAGKRLALLNAAYGPSTDRLLVQAGVSTGMRVVDFGCGTGNVTRQLARIVGSLGHVTGLDASLDQLKLAEQQTLEAGIHHASFKEANVYESGLPQATFDVAYARLILCHLQRPHDMLREMMRLLRPGGTMICEDLDIGSLASDPPSDAYARIVELSVKTAQARGVDYQLGAKLFQCFRSVGLHPEINVVQPAYSRGEEKRVWEYTFLEAAPQMVSAGLTTQEEVERLKRELASVAANPDILVYQTRFVQAWARVAFSSSCRPSC